MEAVGLALLLATATAIGAIAGWRDCREWMREQAVQHGAARYNSQTAKFEWITREPAE